MVEIIEVVTRACPWCGFSSTMEVEARRFDHWQAGLLIQNAFPSMPVDERELLLTGTHPACWDAMFGPEDEDDYPEDLHAEILRERDEDGF